MPYIPTNPRLYREAEDALMAAQASETQARASLPNAPEALEAASYANQEAARAHRIASRAEDTPYQAYVEECAEDASMSAFKATRSASTDPSVATLLAAVLDPETHTECAKAHQKLARALHNVAIGPELAYAEALERKAHWHLVRAGFGGRLIEAQRLYDEAATIRERVATNPNQH